MISVHKALDIINRQQAVLHQMIIPVNDALNFYLATDVKAPMDLPSFDNSAMDGYAVCGHGTSFRVIGEIQAGDTRKLELTEGMAYRIFTGAKVPEYCDAVIMQENAEVVDHLLEINDKVEKGKNIRKKGEQIKNGEMVFKRGQKINPSVIGLLHSLGIKEISVTPRPQLALLTTGNELVPAGQSLEPGQIYESNTATLKSAMLQMGFKLAVQEHVPDDYQSTKIAIQEQLKKCQVLIISGGISVGDYDYVKKALEENDVQELFYKVDQKPGKPLFFGRKGETFIFGLPGNPASSLVCFYLYVVPLLQKLSGAIKTGLPRFYLPLQQPFEMKFDRPTFLKARITVEGVTILEGQGSSMLHSMASGNGLVFISEKGGYKQNQLVECICIDNQ